MKLITEFAEKISEKLVHNGIVPKEDAPLYQYGIENAITVAGNLLASVTFGIISGRLGVVLVFLFCLGKIEYFYAGYSSLILVAVFMVIGGILTIVGFCAFLVKKG